MAATRPNRDRRAALVLAAGAALALVVRWLILQSHGPTGEDQGREILGLTLHDFERWAVGPGLLLLWGLWSVGRPRAGSEGPLGRPGFALLFGGYALAVLGQITAYVLFDPFDHPMHGVGFLVTLVALLPIALGWLLTAIEIARSAPLPRWLAAPALITAVGSVVPLFAEDWLVATFSIDPGTVIQACQSIGFGGLAVAGLRPQRNGGSRGSPEA